LAAGLKESAELAGVSQRGLSKALRGVVEDPNVLRREADLV
jgi:hypothetical protein